MKKRILFLTSDTGGGHRSVAIALGKELEKYGFECFLPDFFLEATKPPFNQFPRYYVNITKEMPIFWGGLWYLTYPKSFYSFLNKIVEYFTPDYLKDFFSKYEPIEGVISVHPLLNHFPFRCLKRIYPNIKLIIVGIELASYHQSWFCSDADLIIVPLISAEDKFLKNGIKKEKITALGIPLRDSFSKNYDEKLILKKYTIDSSKKKVLVLGGSEGWGKIPKVIEAILKKTPYTLICVCGRNEKLYNYLQKRNFDEDRIRLFPYIEEIAEIFSIADVCITKAGSLSLAEAIYFQVPIIIYHYLYGQEFGNVQFIERANLGFYEKSIKGIIEKLVLILETDLGSQIKKRMSNYKEIEGREKIAKLIYKLLKG